MRYHRIYSQTDQCKPINQTDHVCAHLMVDFPHNINPKSLCPPTAVLRSCVRWSSTRGAPGTILNSREIWTVDEHPTDKKKEDEDDLYNVAGKVAMWDAFIFIHVKFFKSPDGHIGLEIKKCSSSSAQKLKQYKNTYANKQTKNKTLSHCYSLMKKIVDITTGQAGSGIMWYL